MITSQLRVCPALPHPGRLPPALPWPDLCCGAHHPPLLSGEPVAVGGACSEVEGMVGEKRGTIFLLEIFFFGLFFFCLRKGGDYRCGK